MILVTLAPGEKDSANNFVDITASATPSASPVTLAPTNPDTASISGTVKDDDGNPIPTVALSLKTPDGLLEIGRASCRERV